MKQTLIYLLLSTFTYANSYALIMGTDKNGLEGAVNDVRAIEKVLKFSSLHILNVE